MIGTATAGNTTALVGWSRPANGGSAITGYTVRVLNATTLTQVGALRPAAAGATSLKVTGLVNGVAVRFQVAASNAVGTGAFSARSNAVMPTRAPLAPVIGTASPGVVGGAINAVARWTPPAPNGGPAINGYLVIALRINAAGTVTSQTTSTVQAASVRSLWMTLRPGNYRFVVQAHNSAGWSPTSLRSHLVIAR